MERLDKINRRLGQIQDELLVLGPDDFRRKNELHSERDGLRAEAAGFKKDLDADRPSSDLIEELKTRRSQLQSIAVKYINPAKLSDAGFGGVGAYNGPADAQSINRNIDSASGKEAIVDRMAHLESILSERGHL